jgi:D-glycero-D-manno-heptose 1,7-bisphosphate phosphatase
MRIVFLDRDGVINEYPGDGFYVTTVKGCRLLPGSVDAVRELTEAGFKIFIISNQAGVGKGVFSADKLKRINAKVVKAVSKAGGKITNSFYCTHRPDEGCDCRKPKTGLIKMALKSIGKTMSEAKGLFFVGDTEGDIQTGHNAGCKKILVLSGRDSKADARRWKIKPDYIVDNLKAATEIILHENPSHSRNRGRRA